MQRRVRGTNHVQMGSYVYHIDQRSQYGSEWDWGEGGRFELDRLYCVEQHVKMNTIGKADGILRAWVNGKQVFERADIRFRSAPELKVKGVWINVYVGGSWTSEQDMDACFDDVVISSGPIGIGKQRDEG